MFTFDELEVLQAADLAQYSAVNAGSNFKGLILLTCVNALLYNVVHYLMIQRTSAVTTTVLGEIKIIGLLFASAFLLGMSGAPALPTLPGFENLIISARKWLAGCSYPWSVCMHGLSGTLGTSPSMRQGASCIPQEMPAFGHTANVRTEDRLCSI